MLRESYYIKSVYIYAFVCERDRERKGNNMERGEAWRLVFLFLSSHYCQSKVMDNLSDVAVEWKATRSLGLWACYYQSGLSWLTETFNHSDQSLLIWLWGLSFNSACEPCCALWVHFYPSVSRFGDTCHTMRQWHSGESHTGPLLTLQVNYSEHCTFHQKSRPTSHNRVNHCSICFNFLLTLNYVRKWCCSYIKVMILCLSGTAKVRHVSLQKVN